MIWTFSHYPAKLTEKIIKKYFFITLPSNKMEKFIFTHIPHIQSSNKKMDLELRVLWVVDFSYPIFVRFTFLLANLNVEKYFSDTFSTNRYCFFYRSRLFWIFSILRFLSFHLHWTDSNLFDC